MYEKTIEALKLYLKDIFGVPVYYTDKDNVFSELSKDDSSLELPIISFFDSEPDINLRGGITYELTDSPISNGVTNIINYYPVTATIEAALIANTLNKHKSNGITYFDLLRRYIIFCNINQITVTSFIDGIEHTIDCSISNLGKLTLPPKGLERRDYDSSQYYVKEFSFNIETALIAKSEEPYIKNINYNYEV